MAQFTIKIVDHTNSSDGLKGRIQNQLQGLFNEVFADTKDSATVSWGTGAASDNAVIHFVDDVGSSYIDAQWKGATIRADAGGHTRSRGKVSGSEFYKHDVIGGKRTMMRDGSYGNIAFHELLHNVLPGWSADDLHGDKGGGGLAAAHPKRPLTPKNIELMRSGLSVKTEQLL
jgi:hypothetical protein